MLNRTVTYCVIVVISLYCSSCNLYKDRFSYVQLKNEKQSWIDSYKYEAFYGCIKGGVGNDSLRVILRRKDLFYPNSEIGFKYIDDARARGKAVIEKTPPPYIKIDIGEEEWFEGKNYISFTCLNYYASRDLERLARRKHKESRKQE
ncbi:MAG: hypothetical protein KF870_12570 [Leadbetterella sp.]|nr:hypothetical protein [Leadbetterella sp.]